LQGPRHLLVQTPPGLHFFTAELPSFAINFQHQDVSLSAPADGDFSAVVPPDNVLRYLRVQYPTSKPSNAVTTTADFGGVCCRSVLFHPFHFSAGVKL
jgi:hypothetical protein